MATQTTTAYWLNGTPYCVECAEHELSPCMSDAERERAIRQDGIGCCGCCQEPFASDEDE